GQKQWNFIVSDKSRIVKTQSIPYVFQSEIPDAPDSVIRINLPRAVTVAEDNSHTQISPAGVYHLYPVKCVKFLAIGAQDKFFQIRLADNSSDFIERRYVSVEDDSALPLARVGNGECKLNGDTSVCQFSVTRPVVWNAELLSDN